MLAQATTVNDVRPGEALEQQYGYLPEDGAYGCCNPHGFMSTLLEYDSEDLALAQFAADMGDRSDASMLTRRANNWENLFDPDNDLLTSRLANGQFEPGVTPTFTGTFPTDGEPYVEGDPYEYLWDVPNDYSALFSLLGGNANVRPMLEQYLSKPNGFGMFMQISNEFDEGEQFAPDYAGDPAGTQNAVNDIRNNTVPAGTRRPGQQRRPRRGELRVHLGDARHVPGELGPRHAGVRESRIPEGDDPSGQRARDPHHSARCVAEHLLRQVAQDRRTAVLEAVGRLRHASPRGASLDWTLGTAPTSWGSAAADAPPSYTDGLRPVVGFLSDQSVTIAPGSSATVQVGAQNATANAAERTRRHLGSGRKRPVRLAVERHDLGLA